MDGTSSTKSLVWSMNGGTISAITPAISTSPPSSPASAPIGRGTL